MRVVFDTNVWVSAVSARGTASRLRDALALHGAIMFISPFILEEIDRTLKKPWFAWPDAEREAVLSYLREVAAVVRPHNMPLATKDLADNAVLACALSAKAQFLVTGDKALRDLHTWRGIRIVTPAELLHVMSARRPTRRSKTDE